MTGTSWSNYMSSRGTADDIAWLKFSGQSNDPPPAAAPAAPAAWSQPGLADPDHLSWTDNAENEAGFRVERCTGAGCANFTQIAQVGAGVTQFLGCRRAAQDDLQLPRARVQCRWRFRLLEYGQRDDRQIAHALRATGANCAMACQPTFALRTAVGKPSRSATSRTTRTRRATRDRCGDIHVGDYSRGSRGRGAPQHATKKDRIGCPRRRR